MIGDLVVGVAAARVGATNRSAECLTLTLRITNLAEKPINYTSWSESSVPVVLRDQNRNYYNRIASRTQSEQVINPGRTITDIIEFESPPKGVMLELDLPVAGGDKSFRFQIPPILVQQAGSSLAATPKKQDEATPATPPPAAAEQDQELVGKVVADYRDGVKRIAQRVLGMETNNGQRFKKNAMDKLLKSLATKYELKLEQVQRMVK